MKTFFGLSQYLYNCLSFIYNFVIGICKKKLSCIASCLILLQYIFFLCIDFHCFSRKYILCICALFFLLYTYYAGYEIHTQIPWEFEYASCSVIAIGHTAIFQPRLCLHFDTQKHMEKQTGSQAAQAGRRGAHVAQLAQRKCARVRFAEVPTQFRIRKYYGKNFHAWIRPLMTSLYCLVSKQLQS